ncbi:hypothetical protein PRK78_005769 [Emydomyces testavorans]|uniref:Uncharacterized protein n=1 Tax=Emydomyces testavorans TaxID=2070801 RepID=A0AAF0IMY0_9EURO|nr:hypothetical protein PRK78_005769 [Emydomyces testavorans]
MDEGNRPQLVHTPSQQSIAASSDYYSFSDVTASSDRSKITVLRYQTPPSRNISPGEAMTNGASRDQVSGQSEPQNTIPASQAGGREDTGTPTPGIDDTPYIRFAIDQLTRDEELGGQGRHGTIISTEDYPTERIVPDEGLEYYTPPSTQRDNQWEKEEPEEARDDPNEVLLPADPPEDGYRYSPLNAVPYVLRPLLLGPLILVCLFMIAALVFCAIWSQKHDGLSKYSGFGGSRYFVFQFLPQLLAISIIIWVHAVQAAVYRIIPLSILARTAIKRQALQKLSMLPQNFILPDLSHFRHGEPLIGVCFVAIWATSFITVPLQSCLFLPKWYGSADEGGFKWTSIRAVAWVLVALYVLLTAALTAIMIRFNSGITGLQWDVVCLADIIPLIHKSNILHDYDQAEIVPKVEEFLPPRSLRLGYWRTSAGPDIFYALGEENAPLHRLPDQDGYQKRRGVKGSVTDLDVERQQLNSKNSLERNLQSPSVRFRWAPWFLRDTFVVAWVVIALVLLIAFIAVSFANRSIQNGFLPLLPTLASPAGFSPSNFLYSFIPTLIGTFFFLAWQPFDIYFRAVQPFSSLSSPNGASAESSLLLSYNSSLPVEVTFLALANRHYKVAYISLVSFISLGIPVLAGGVFMAHWYAADNEIRISAYLPAYYTLMAFSIIYALSFFSLWLRRKRHLPHGLSTYADVISFLYQSPLLADKIFREPKTKIDLVTRTMIPLPGEGEKALYAFGVYHGLDGKEHLGIDRLRRPGRGELLVSPPPGRRLFAA